jgi:hypothetical protein
VSVPSAVVRRWAPSTDVAAIGYRLLVIVALGAVLTLFSDAFPNRTC